MRKAILLIALIAMITVVAVNAETSKTETFFEDGFFKATPKDTTIQITPIGISSIVAGELTEFKAQQGNQWFHVMLVNGEMQKYKTKCPLYRGC